MLNENGLCFAAQNISDRPLYPAAGATSMTKKEHAFWFDLHKHAVNWSERFSRIPKRDQTEIQLYVTAVKAIQLRLSNRPTT